MDKFAVQARSGSGSKATRMAVEIAACADEQRAGGVESGVWGMVTAGVWASARRVSIEVFRQTLPRGKNCVFGIVCI